MAVKIYLDNMLRSRTGNMSVQRVNGSRYKTAGDVLTAISVIAGTLKTQLCGMTSVAFIAMGNCIDHLKANPEVWRKAKRRTLLAQKAHRQWEYRLTNPMPGQLALFGIEEMEPHLRKIFTGDMKSADYLEFWQLCGGEFWTDAAPFVGSLAHKYELSLEKNGVPHARLAGEVCAVNACLWVQSVFYDRLIKAAVEDSGFGREDLQRYYSMLNLKPVAEAWQKMLTDLIPHAADDNVLSQVEAKNIGHGLNDLKDILSDDARILATIQRAMEDLPEFFRTKGEQRKMLRSISDLRSEVDEESRRRILERHRKKTQDQAASA